MAEHFARAQVQALNTIIYQNFEAVPEKVDIADPFRQVDLFKLPPWLAGELSEAARRLIEYTPQIPPKRFNFYSNGKSAVRLNAPDLRPNGVHRFANWNAHARNPSRLRIWCFIFTELTGEKSTADGSAIHSPMVNKG